MSPPGSLSTRPGVSPKHYSVWLYLLYLRFQKGNLELDSEAADPGYTQRIGKLRGLRRLRQGKRKPHKGCDYQSWRNRVLISGVLPDTCCLAPVPYFRGDAGRSKEKEEEQGVWVPRVVGSWHSGPAQHTWCPTDCRPPQ